MTNTTGICRRSPGCSVCFAKQKHSSFLKYWPACAGRNQDSLPGECAVSRVDDLAHHRRTCRDTPMTPVGNRTATHLAGVGIELDPHFA
jgi:hypothetical protein